MCVANTRRRTRKGPNVTERTKSVKVRRAPTVSGRPKTNGEIFTTFRLTVTTRCGYRLARIARRRIDEVPMREPFSKHQTTTKAKISRVQCELKLKKEKRRDLRAFQVGKNFVLKPGGRPLVTQNVCQLGIQALAFQTSRTFPFLGTFTTVRRLKQRRERTKATAPPKSY